MGLLDFLFSKNKQPQPAPVSAASNQLLQPVEIIPGVSIPKAFVKHWPEIEKTKLSFISIKATQKNDLALEQSKFGHYPCMPLDFEYPTDEAGQPMFPLAQINCKEIPALPGYPASGYLQFYISASDDVYGMDFKDPQAQNNFRMLYFEEQAVEKYKADFSFLDELMESDMLPLNKPYALSFEMEESYIGIGDVRYEESPILNLSAIAKQYPEIEEELEEALYDTEAFAGNGHKMGGYAYFTQEDPRMGSEKFADFILLLQIDTDDEIMWGDSGVANFFIHPDDLAKKDFSKVIYNWDCC